MEEELVQDVVEQEREKRRKRERERDIKADFKSFEKVGPDRVLGAHNVRLEDTAAEIEDEKGIHSSYRREGKEGMYAR